MKLRWTYGAGGGGRTRIRNFVLLREMGDFKCRVEKRVENVDKKISVIGSDKSQLPPRLRLFFLP